MATESDVTKGVSNDTIETYYYVIFWLVAITAGLVVMFELYIMTISPKRGFNMFLRSAPALILGVVNAMFLYILSVRALK
jgi:hypothetical protein